MVELDLGGIWRYQPTDSPDFSLAAWDDSSWPTMDIPQNWFWAGLDHHGVVWFRRTSEPPTLQGQMMVTNRGRETAVSLTLTCAPKNFNNADTYQTSFTLTLPPGQSQHAFALPVSDVRRWQPWDRGFSHLYQFTIHNPQFAINYSSTVGFRTVAVDDNYRWKVQAA